MESVKVNTSQHIDIDYPVAGLGERIAARLIDLACFFGLYILFILLVLLSGVSGLMDASPYILYIALGLYFGGYIFYNLICEIFMNGQCIGKRLMKIKVISLDGGQASMGQYFIRWVFRLIDFTLTGQLAGLICVAVSDRKQRIGDMVAGTTVIKTVPRTNFSHLAFNPVEETYNPVFHQVTELSDRDIELIHEVLNTFYKTNNAALIYNMSARISAHLNLTIPTGMNELDFLRTVVKDYNSISSKAN